MHNLIYPQTYLIAQTQYGFNSEHAMQSNIIFVQRVLKSRVKLVHVSIIIIQLFLYAKCPFPSSKAIHILNDSISE